MFTEDANSYDIFIRTDLLKNFEYKIDPYPSSTVIRPYLFGLTRYTVRLEDIKAKLYRLGASFDEMEREYWDGESNQDGVKNLQLICSSRLYDMAKIAIRPHSLAVLIHTFIYLFDKGEYSINDVLEWEKGNVSPHGLFPSLHVLIYRHYEE